MKIGDTPEEIIRIYFNWLHGIGAPALNPVAQEGRIYAKECPACHHQVRHTRKKGLEMRIDVCGRCGRPWDYEDRYALRGSFQLSLRPGSTEHRLSPWCDVGSVLLSLYEDTDLGWSVKTFCTRAHGFLTLKETAEGAYRQWPEAPFKWTRDRVALLYDRGREACGRAFTQRGWLPGEWPSQS